MKNSSASNPARATNARRDTLQSLLALAAGAASLGALAPAAQAGIFYTPFTPPKTVGWGSGLLTYTFDLPGTASLILARDAAPSGTNTDANRILAKAVGGLIGRQADARSAAPNPPGVNVALRTAYGQNWNNAVRTGAGTFGNIILSSITTNFIIGPGAFNSMKYLLFTFTNTEAGNQTQYGWIGMSGATYTGNMDGMSVTFTGIAYEDSGAVINAGDMGASPVPEASTGVVSALVASLVVGSESLRRWRKAKPVKVSQPA